MVENVKGSTMSFFKIYTSKDYSKLARGNKVYGGGKESKKTKIKQKQPEGRIIRDTAVRCEQEEDYYKPVKVCNIYNYNYIKYESNGDRSITLLVKEHLDEIKSCKRYQISKNVIHGNSINNSN